MSPHCHTFIQALRDKGYRLTPQREMVIEALAHSGKHMSAEEVYAQVQDRARAVNIATVYRTLELLVAEGLATRMLASDGRMVYATGRHGPHVHLVCRKCGKAFEANEALVAALGERILAQYGFAADLQHLAISGLCADCCLAGSGQAAPAE